MKSYIKTIITVAVTAAVTFSATSMIYTTGHMKFASDGSNARQLKNKIDTIDTYLENNYLYDDIDYQKANTAAVKAYVESLDEPYTHYYSKDEFESYMNGVEESYVGIGVIISADTENDKIVVVSPIKDSPAYDAGMKSGDFILSVDGESFDASGMNDCVTAIKNGEEGTKVNITIERDGKTYDYVITRQEIIENSVSFKMLDDGIGYVAISGFNTNSDSLKNTTYTEFVEAVESLKADGMKKMIIDVRDNPGGVLNIVCQIADYLLPEGIITYTETRTGEREEYTSKKGELDIPMVVLINGSSASASEILAGALKDYDRAEIVGVTSFGKGIVQTVFPFTDGSGMSMTVSKYFTPSGKSIHGVGVEPDVKVELPKKYKDSYISEIPEGEDTQLNKAVEILKAQ